MAFIEHFCGSKFGGWKQGTERFADVPTAQQEIRRRTKDERQADITPMLRRASA